MSTASRHSYGRAPFSRMLTGGALGGLGTTAVVAMVLAITVGPVAAGSALAAGIVVSATFAFGVVALTFVLAGPGAQPSLALPGALIVYTAQLTVLVALGLVVRDTVRLDDLGVALGGILSVIGWIVGQVWGFSTARVLVFSPAPGSAR